MQILIEVTEKVAAVSGAPVIVCGNSDYTVVFAFDSEWDACPEKTARFACIKNGVLWFEDVTFEGDSVSVPVLREADEVTVGVYAGSLSTSTPARIPCARCITDGDAVRDPPAVDIYNQLMERLAELRGGQPGGKVRLRTWSSAFASGMKWSDAAIYKWQEAGT